MKTYIIDIFRKIQKFSQRLDNLVMLKNQRWVVLDELKRFKTVYIFRDNSELLIAVDGKVKKARWEYIDQNSILIDIQNSGTYLFRHGFFDENILALKLDSKDEYAILINESRYSGELNSIEKVIDFLNKKYTKLIKRRAVKLTFIRDIITTQMGAAKEYSVNLSDGHNINIYQKKSNGNYFIYSGGKIISFTDSDSCVKYIEELPFN